jgi:predicted NAD-dependent protein-ADP-ribosyltransferase YbiA (DUF1768 family)
MSQPTGRCRPKTPAVLIPLGHQPLLFGDAETAERIRTAPHPAAAKSLGRQVPGSDEQRWAEASPLDRIWGSGLAADDAQATSPAHWPGLNLLGFALMEVRHQLLAPA